MMVGWDVFFGECIRVHWNAFDALAREHQARLAFGEGVASGSFLLETGAVLVENATIRSFETCEI